MEEGLQEAKKNKTNYDQISIILRLLVFALLRFSFLTKKIWNNINYYDDLRKIAAIANIFYV